MRYVTEYRDAAPARRLAERIVGRASRRRVVMEICGGQTHTIVRYGLAELVQPAVEFVHGPGCPVCVTPLGVIDKALALAAQQGVTLATYGDMLRVPGTAGDLLGQKARGGDVRAVYSPLDALALARQHPHREVVFFGVGFETTAPANAMAVYRARAEGIGNFSMLGSHLRVPPAIQMILEAPGNRVEALLAPGHVCTVMGTAEYEQLSGRYGIPIVVAGFEPVDLLEATWMAVEQLESGRAEVENQYARSVRRAGSRAAQAVLEEVFEPCDMEWRGLGNIPGSGLRLRAQYAAWNADIRFALEPAPAPECVDCLAPLILQGRAKPTECPAFGVRCAPSSPLGAPMVSAEGACAAYYAFRRHAVGVEARP